METKETLMKKMSDCVFEMEDEEVVDVVKEYIACGYDPQEGMLGGLVDGMKRGPASCMKKESILSRNSSSVLMQCMRESKNFKNIFRKPRIPASARSQSESWKAIRMILGRTW